jgi:multiple sugar transport system ATP-binding protein
LQHRLGVTTVYATDDQAEALTIGHRVAVMREGILQQVDTPPALCDNPVNLFVAGFVGSPAMNLLHGRLTESGADVGGTIIPLSLTARERSGATASVTLGVRPESFRISDNQGFPMKVLDIEELGGDAFVYGEPESPATPGFSTSPSLVVRVEGRRPFPTGSTVHLTVDPDDVHVFDTETGERIAARASGIPRANSSAG